MIYPMAAMVLLTLYVGIRMFRARVAAVRSGAVSIDYFKTYNASADELPESMVLTQRCYANLMEMPTLFYAGCLAAMVTGAQSVPLLVIAWAYVAFRIGQAAAHLHGNKVLWRMRLFLGSILCLLVLWGWLVVVMLAR